MNPLHHAAQLLPLTIATAVLLTSCINKPRNYEPAGFESWTEVKTFTPHYLYLANRLTDEQWDAFYDRFPEYWKDLQSARGMGMTIEYHPAYTAYAFRWSTLQMRESWDAGTRQRLNAGRVSPGDDVYQLIYAQGPPERIVWDNDFEILLYSNDTAQVITDGKLETVLDCEGCWERDPNPGQRRAPQHGPSEEEILARLGLERPSY